jgi:hypothetical protein
VKSIELLNTQPRHRPGNLVGARIKHTAATSIVMLARGVAIPKFVGEGTRALPFFIALNKYDRQLVIPLTERRADRPAP